VDTLSHKLCKQFATLLSLCLITTSHLYAATVTYQYDALGRLTFVEDAANGNRDYDYDKAGNRLLVSTNTANDTAAEPGAVTFPAPTGLSKSQIANCAWRATWNPVSGAAKYLVKDTAGASVYVTTTFADIGCPSNNPSANMPKSVQACSASNVCGIKANY
jgi:YD repeat-containing protein